MNGWFLDLFFPSSHTLTSAVFGAIGVVIIVTIAVIVVLAGYSVFLKIITTIVKVFAIVCLNVVCVMTLSVLVAVALRTVGYFVSGPGTLGTNRAVNTITNGCLRLWW